MYKEKKKVENQIWIEKTCTREYLYTALRISAAPAPEIKLNQDRKQEILFNCTQEGGSTRVPWDTPDQPGQPSPAGKKV